MTLFDVSSFSLKALLTDEGGPFRVEVWAPAGSVWVPLDRVESVGRFGSFQAALEAAHDWVDAGSVLDPAARIVDEHGRVEWRSCRGEPPRTVLPNPAYL